MSCQANNAAEDIRWKQKAHWNSSIAHLKRIHPNLFIGSRLSVQRILNRQALKDQDGQFHAPSKFFLMCVAGNSVCMYSQCYRKSHAFYMRDRVYDSCDDMIAPAIEIADDMYRMLQSGKSVLIHCHAGQNRASLCIAVMAARYKLVASQNQFYNILREDNRKRGVKSLANPNMQECLNQYWSKA